MHLNIIMEKEGAAYLANIVSSSVAIQGTMGPTSTVAWMTG